MLKANEDTFLHIYFSYKEVLSDTYAPDGIILIWDDYYITSPEILSKYDKYVEKLEEECKLLKVLR